MDAKTTVDTKGLTFNGDSGSTNIEKLGSTVTVAGDDNITTEAQDDKVTVKLNKDLVVDSVKAGDTTVNNDGVKIAIDRIFRGFFKIHGSGDLMPTYSVADFEGDSVETH